MATSAARERPTAEGEAHAGDLAAHLGEFGSLARFYPPDAALALALLLFEYGDRDGRYGFLRLHPFRDAADHRSYAAELFLAREVSRDLLDQSGRDLGSFLKRMAGK